MKHLLIIVGIITLIAVFTITHIADSNTPRGIEKKIERCVQKQFKQKKAKTFEEAYKIYEKCGGK